MEIQKPLFWHQGLFLQPQHFQINDLVQQSLLLPLYRFLTPHFWGAGGFEIQSNALGTGSFNITRGEFLFPDGTFAALPENAVMEARPFKESWVEGGKPLLVHVGLKKWTTIGPNVTTRDKLENLGDATTRFVTTADADEARDLHGEGPGGQVRRLRFLLKIFWETERDKLGDYELLPVALLERFGEEIRVSERYLPPTPSLAGSPLLLKVVKDIRDQIAARGHQLEQYKSQKGVQTAEFGSRDMVYLLALRSLNRYVPVLFHLLEAAQVHPWEVYGLLRQLIGELSSFSEKVTVNGETDEGVRLPPYDHRQLWECFSTAQSLISRLLAEITAGPEYVVHLDSDGTYFTADLKPSVFKEGSRYYLALRTETDARSVLQSVSAIAKLSSREHLPILIARSLPGIRLEHLPTPPSELPRRTGTLYFSVDRHSDEWPHVTKGHNIALYWDNAPEDLAADLMVVVKP